MFYIMFYQLVPCNTIYISTLTHTMQTHTFTCTQKQF